MRPDEALLDPKLDELDRVGFAKALAHSILTMDVDSPFVFSIEGEWGSGKTTVVEFIKYYLRKRDEIGPKVPLETDPIVIDLSPWWFSGGEDLLRQFVNEITLQLRADKKLLGKLKNLPDSLDRLSAALTAHSIAVPYSFKLAFVSKGIAGLLRWFGRTKDVGSIRKEIETILRGQTKRIVVFLDDIDRLQPREMVQVFQVVKAIANLPHIIYVLCFDRTAVVQGLQKGDIHEPDRYIEKIIQSVWTLPTPDALGIAKLTGDVISNLIEETDELWEGDRWRGMYFDGLRKLIRSPRDVNRLANALRPAYPPIRSEVNGVDFIGFHALRILTPTAHDFILTNREWLTTADVRFFRNEDDERKQYNLLIDQMLKALPVVDRDPVSQVLETMFPMFAKNLKRTGISGLEHARWRRACRICSPERFAFYDRLSIPKGAISSAELGRLLRPTSTEAFRADLQRMAEESGSNIESKLKNFLDYADANLIASLSGEERQVLLGELFRVADDFISKLEAPSLPFWSVDIQFARLVNSILGFVPKGQPRIGSTEQVWVGGSAISLMVRCFHLWLEFWQAYSSGRLSQTVYFDGRELGLLSATLEKQVSTAASNGVLATTPLLGLVLAFWDRQGTSDGSRFASRLATSEEGLIALAVGALHPRPHIATEPTYRSDASLLEAWTDTPRSVLATRFERVLASDSSRLSAIQTTALRAFIEEVRNPRDDYGQPSAVTTVS
jgi:predicted KAP-like P-loop ATPase